MSLSREYLRNRLVQRSTVRQERLTDHILCVIHSRLNPRRRLKKAAVRTAEDEVEDTTIAGGLVAAPVLHGPDERGHATPTCGPLLAE